MKDEKRSGSYEIGSKRKGKRMIRERSQVRHQLMQEIREKEKLVKCSRKKRGGHGPVRTPSDALDAQALARLSGSLRIYQLGRPMSRRQFLYLPEDLRRVYVKLLRDKHGASRRDVLELTGEDFGMVFGSGDPEKWQAFLERGSQRAGRDNEACVGE